MQFYFLVFMFILDQQALYFLFLYFLDINIRMTHYIKYLYSILFPFYFSKFITETKFKKYSFALNLTVEFQKNSNQIQTVIDKTVK